MRKDVRRLARIASAVGDIVDARSCLVLDDRGDPVVEDCASRASDRSSWQPDWVSTTIGWKRDAIGGDLAGQRLRQTDNRTWQRHAPGPAGTSPAKDAVSTACRPCPAQAASAGTLRPYGSQAPQVDVDHPAPVVCVISTIGPPTTMPALLGDIDVAEQAESLVTVSDLFSMPDVAHRAVHIEAPRHAGGSPPASPGIASLARLWLRGGRLIASSQPDAWHRQR